MPWPNNLCSGRQKQLQSTPYHQPIPQQAVASVPQTEAQSPTPSTAHATQFSAAGACLPVSETRWAPVQVRHWGTAFPLTVSSDLRLPRYDEINVDQLQVFEHGNSQTHRTVRPSWYKYWLEPEFLKQLKRRLQSTHVSSQGILQHCLSQE